MTPATVSMRLATFTAQVFICLVLISSASSQQSAPAQGSTDHNDRIDARTLPDAPSSAQQTSQSDSAKTNCNSQAKDCASNSRIFGLAPQFNVVNGPYAPPLTPREKGRLFLRSSIDPFTFLVVGLRAGISQANDAHAGYGQGAAGFGKRYGAALADQVDGALWGTFLLPVLLKEDPRYYRKGEGSVAKRALYAFASSFFTRTDRGTRRFNYSNVLGNFIAGGISNAYYPDEDRGFALTMKNAAVVTVLGGLGAEGSEFWPDIDCLVIHRKRCKLQKEAAAQQRGSQPSK